MYPRSANVSSGEEVGEEVFTEGVHRVRLENRLGGSREHLLLLCSSIKTESLGCDGGKRERKEGRSTGGVQRH